MSDESNDSSVETTGTWTVSQHDADALREAATEAGLDYDELSEKQKLKLAEGVEPERVDEIDNVTCVGLHRAMTRLLDASYPNAEPVEQLALGRGSDESQMTTDSEELIDEVDRTTVTSYARQESETLLHCVIFVDEGEANVATNSGETISEGGLIVGTGAESEDNWELVNHTLLSQEYQKDASKTLTMEYDLSFSDGGSSS